MKNEAALLFLCFSAVLTAGLAGCARADGAAGAEKVEANYPEVWERVLPKEMRTNIANYDAGDLYPVEKEYTDLLDYAVSTAWRLDEVYHIDGEEHDDVIFRFVDWKKGKFYSFDATIVVYYSFFGGRLLSKNDSYKFPTVSTVQEVVPAGSIVRRLPFTDFIDKYIIEHQGHRMDRYIYPPKITLSNGVIYDADIENYRYRENMPESHSEPYYPDIACHDPPKWGPLMEDTSRKYYWTSHKEGVQFLPVGYVEKDIVREDSWLLLQGLDEPRIVSKYCIYLGTTILPVRVYSYYEYSFVRADDNVISLPDGTFMFSGTRNSFPAFHIIRMQSDMSIPVKLSSRYRWVRYKDYVGILELYEKNELFSGRNKTCPLLDATHPHCVKTGEDGYCSEIKGGYLDYERKFLSGFRELADGNLPVKYLSSSTSSCLNLALRDYVRGEFEIYHCGEGDETVASIMPCDKKDNDNGRI